MATTRSSKPGAATRQKRRTAPDTKKVSVGSKPSSAKTAPSATSVPSGPTAAKARRKPVATAQASSRTGSGSATKAGTAHGKRATPDSPPRGGIRSDPPRKATTPSAGDKPLDKSTDAVDDTTRNPIPPAPEAGIALEQLQALNSMMLGNAEELFEMQIEAIRRHSQATLGEWRDMVSLKDPEEVQSFLTSRPAVLLSLSTAAVGDLQKMTSMGLDLLQATGAAFGLPRKDS